MEDGHSMGSFAAQQCVVDHSEFINGLALSGTGALDGLVRLAESRKRTPAEIVNAAFEPARTPCDWLSRDPATVDAFMNDPCVSGGCNLRRTSHSSASPPGWPIRSVFVKFGTICLYVYFRESDDPVGQQLEGVSVLIERYRADGVRNISHDFYAGGRHEMLNEIDRDEVRANLFGWINRVLSATFEPTASHVAKN